jgi:hypothetical protein
MDHADGTRCRTDRVPWGFAAMLAIVAAVEASLAPAPTNPLADIWAEAYVEADSDEVRKSAVICLGDSQVKLGLNALELGVPAYNLAVHAGQPAASEALLRRALDAGARPRAVVLGFHPAVLAYEARTNIRQWPEVLGTWGCLGLAIEARDAHLAALGVLGSVFSSCKGRLEIRRDVLASLRGSVDPAVAVVARGRAERATHRGSVVAAPVSGFRDEPAPESPSGPASSWTPRRENLAALRRLLALAQSRGIAVYWVTPALSPRERGRRERSGLNAAYDRLLGRLQEDFPTLVVLESSGLELGASVFVDPLHLDGRGALALTESVGRAMKRPGPRRVVLGPTGGGDGAAIARQTAADRPRPR